MSLASNLSKARSNIIFIVALVAAACIVVAVERSDLGATARRGPDRAAERAAAAYAWGVLQAEDPGRAEAVRGRARRIGVETAPARVLTPEGAEAVMRAMDR